MRCFVAVGGEGDLAGALREWLPQTRERFPELSVTPPGNLHLTLAFLGELDEAQVKATGAAVDGAAAAVGRGFDVGWGEPGGFPGGRRPRVLWLGVGVGADELAAANKALRRELNARGVAADDKPYRPHLTLARVRRPPLPAERLAELQDWLAKAPAPPPLRVASLVLYRSTLGRPAAAHSPVHVAALR